MFTSSTYLWRAGTICITTFIWLILIQYLRGVGIWVSQGKPPWGLQYHHCEIFLISKWNFPCSSLSFNLCSHQEKCGSSFSKCFQEQEVLSLALTASECGRFLHCRSLFFPKVWSLHLLLNKLNICFGFIQNWKQK